MSKTKKCLVCGADIPATRKKTARYCSNAHSNEARRRRASETYYRMKKPLDEIKRNESILASLYWIKNELKKDVTIKDLEKMNFNLDLSENKLAGKNDTLWTLIGSYAYYIDPKTKAVSIWKQS